MRLADYVASYIAGRKVKHVFSVCGGGAMHLVDAFGSTQGMHYVHMHHEQAAAMAAEAYARVTENLGAVVVTTGPGGTNAITGLYGAWIDSIPVIFISGQVTRDMMINQTGLRQFGIQEGDIVNIVKPITKYAQSVTDPDTVRYHLEKACYLATTGRPGPVWLDIPLDLQSRQIDPDSLAGFSPDALPPAEAEPKLCRDVAGCIEALRAARRPVLKYGYGVRLAGAGEALNRVVRRLGIPTISSWTSSDIIPSHDDNYIGRSGIMGDRAGNFSIQNADLLLIVGSRMSIPQVGYQYKLFAREARIIMVDIDGAELNKPSLTVDIPIQADAGVFLEELLRQLELEKQPPLDIDDWRQRCRGWKLKYPVVLPEYLDNTYKVNSFYFVETLSDRLGKDAIVVTDMGTSFTCTMQTFKTKRGQRLFTSSGLAAMGFGLPGAIGAYYAAGRKTILIVGDGGLQVNVQELQTVVHHRLPILIFVINNEGYLTIKHMQTNHFRRRVGSDSTSGLSCPDTLKLAFAYGIACERICDQKALDERIDAVLEHPGPYVCEIMMPEEQALIPRTSSMKLSDGTLVAKPLEDLYPFLDREEFLENMIVAPVSPGQDWPRCKHRPERKG